MDLKGILPCDSANSCTHLDKDGYRMDLTFKDGTTRRVFCLNNVTYKLQAERAESGRFIYRLLDLNKDTGEYEVV